MLVRTTIFVIAHLLIVASTVAIGLSAGMSETVVASAER